MSNIVIDISAAAADTIDYVVTDQAGNTATSTRAIMVDASASTADPRLNARMRLLNIKPS